MRFLGYGALFAIHVWSEAHHSVRIVTPFSGGISMLFNWRQKAVRASRATLALAVIIVALDHWRALDMSKVPVVEMMLGFIRIPQTTIVDGLFWYLIINIGALVPAFTRGQPTVDKRCLFCEVGLTMNPNYACPTCHRTYS